MGRDNRDMDTPNDNGTDTGTPIDSAAERGQVVASAAEVYEQFFVPALFGQFAPVAVDRADVGPGDRLLDVACGTGIVARAGAQTVGSGGTVVGVDINPAMLTVARRLSDEIEWIEAPAEALPVESGYFDAAVCQFGLMFMTDPGSAVREMVRAVRPGRPVVFATWAEVSASPGYEAMIQLLDDECGSEAANALRAPFSIGTDAALAAIVEPEVDDVEVTIERGVARFPSLEAWLQTDIRGWTLADMIDDEQFGALLHAAQSRLVDFVAPSGEVTFAAPAVIAVGHRNR